MARNPAYEMLAVSVETGLMLAEAQAVIGLRTLGLMGLWSLGPRERTRMWAEKAGAVRQGGVAAATAALSGATPAAIAAAALKPVRRRTRANARRLARRGPAPMF